MIDGSAVVSIVDGVSTDMLGSAGTAGGITGICTAAGGRVMGTGLPRVAVVHPLTYSVANNKSHKE